MLDPLQENRPGELVPCGVLAGIFARIDARRGVWKAPAGTEATFTGVRGLVCKLTDGESGTLNALGVNCLRTFPAIGNILWGARTLEGADRLQTGLLVVTKRLGSRPGRRRLCGRRRGRR